MQPMVTKNHKQSMSQPERAFWRDVFLRALIVPSNGEKHFPDDAASDAADYANAAVREYRKTITWRNEP